MIRKLFIANRGEVALRVARAAADMALPFVAAPASEDVAAYLDGPALVRAALAAGCDAVHPGWGFLSERADFAQACADGGLVFVGPAPGQLALFGDKASARALAQQHGVPVLAGSAALNSLQQARDVAAGLFDGQRHGTGVIVKAVGGGGGRGMRAVHHIDGLPAAYERCVAEARAAFGTDAVFIERLLPRARHIEVQLIGDGHTVVALGDRDCSLQRRFQKLVEIAPSPRLPQALRQAIVDAALTLARAVGYRSLGTFEFLVDSSTAEPTSFFFIEANPRLQVEHTVTEAVTGLDLVQLQIAVAGGSNLLEVGLDPARPPLQRGHAIQWRINAETLDSSGASRPAAGTLQRLVWPSGPGIRVDSAAQQGHTVGVVFDTLLAKLVVHSGGSLADTLRRSRRALAECGIDGVASNLPLLRALALRPELEDGGSLHTGLVEEHLGSLVPAGVAPPPTDHDTQLRSPMAGRLVQLLVQAGDTPQAGSELAVIEAMKMQHALVWPGGCRVLEVCAEVGAMLAEGQLLLRLQPLAGGESARHAEPLPQAARADLQRLRERLAMTADDARPEAVARRHAQGRRTAREIIAGLCDAGSFVEVGALAVAAQRSRRSADDLARNTPADGLVAGIGSVNGAACGAERSRTVVMAYDASVLAGTQGFRNHQKTDRLLGLALQSRLPVLLWAEGGGGRPGDTDMPIVAGLHVGTFAALARLSGKVPLVGVVGGRCFAGNAALLGCCDVIVATRSSNIGMGGPAMVEGGGLGVFAPEQIGPAAVQWAGGVIDVLVENDADAVIAARQYLSYFQGEVTGWHADEQSTLRDAVPPQRQRVYDIRHVLHAVFDRGSLLELRAGFGNGIVTALARIEGRPLGVLANNPLHLGGAIDANAADKAARFMQLCNAHGLPLVSLIDTPGFMVGPDAEKQAQVRHVSRMFVAGAALRVPFFGVVLRKGYGLGAMAMAAGGFHCPDLICAWPSGEFGAMGLEGAVRLGYRKELQAAAEGAERDALYQRLVAASYEAGSAINMAATLEIDAVIDPADTRSWLLHGLQSARVRQAGPPFIDTW